MRTASPPDIWDSAVNQGVTAFVGCVLWTKRMLSARLTCVTTRQGHSRPHGTDEETGTEVKTPWSARPGNRNDATRTLASVLSSLCFPKCARRRARWGLPGQCGYPCDRHRHCDDRHHSETDSEMLGCFIWPNLWRPDQGHLHGTDSKFISDAETCVNRRKDQNWRGWNG